MRTGANSGKPQPMPSHQTRNARLKLRQICDCISRLA